AFTPDGKLLLTGSLDKTVKVWDVAGGKELRTLAAHDDWVLSVAVSRDGRFFVSGSKDRTARVWDLRTWKPLHTLRGPSPVEGVGISPDGKTIATAGWGVAGSPGPLRLWDAATGKEVGTLTGHPAQVSVAAFSPDGTTLATCSHDQTVRLWDVATGAEQAVLRGHTGILFALAFTPDGKSL